MSEYHPFKKNVIGKNGKIIQRWYYYYYDPATGKQVQKACRKCKTKSEAEAYIDKLPPLRSDSVTVNRISSTMFVPGSDHYERRRQLGKSVKPDTLVECRGYLRLIKELWGEKDIRDLTVVEVQGYLLKDTHSGSWKNRFLEILGEIYSEAPWYGCTVVKPEFSRFTRNSKKADILSTEEIEKLFKEKNFENRMFYVMFLLALSGGMRLGEVRAFRPCQFIDKKQAILIDGFLNKKGDRNPYNKKGSDENPRLRVTIIAKFTSDIVKNYIEEKKCPPNELLFQYEGKPVRQEYAESVFKRALRQADIKTGTRKIVPHSLRYTYVTRMRRSASADTVGKMSGHTSIEMTDYYTRAALDEMIDALLPVTAAADHFFA